ncbi:hypothetical protein Tco_0132635 [Tanacetum coccineum]
MHKMKLDSEFTPEETNRENADTQAEIILSQGTDFTAKGKCPSDDMKITQLAIPTHQLNTKFVNNLPSYWGKYVTNGKGMLQGRQRTKESEGFSVFKAKMLLMEAKIRDVTLDVEAEAFLANVECTAPYDQPLAMTTTNIFEVNHEDAYDSDVDEGPNAAAAFMANVSSISGTNGATTNQVNETPRSLSRDIDDNTFPYHQYQHDREVQDVPMSAEVSMAKIKGKPGHVRPASGFYEKLNAMMFVPQKELSREQVDICSIVLYSDVAVTTSSNCSCDNLRLECDREHNKVLELEAEISKQKRLITESEKCFAFLEQNYALDTDRIQVASMITSLKDSVIGLKIENLVHGKTSSGPSASEKPNVLASGMYINSSKYVPPPKRANWVKPTPLPKRKQANISVNHTKKVWKETRNHNVNTTKTAWRPTGKVVGSVKPQWKPTGRHFTLYDNCPLTRIMEPIVEPLELTLRPLVLSS